jgi:foldase protein PrsA
MGEGIPQTASAKTPLVNRLGLMIGGTTLVLLAGLVIMQTMRAPQGQAASEEEAARVAGAKRTIDVLARVDGETIPYEMVANECVARHGKEVLDDLINRMVIQRACEKQGVTVTEDEVTAEVTRIAQRFSLDPAGWYQMLQNERNISPQQYRQSVIWPMIALKKLAGEQVDITEEELEQAFVRNYGPRVKCRLIVLDNHRRARECWDEANRNPEEFEKLAQKYSIDPNSRPLGGTIPPIPRFSGNQALETAAFKLKDGEISGIIELQTGRYAILKSEGRTEQVVEDIADVRDTLYDDLFEQKTQQMVAEVFETVKKETRVDNFLTQTTTGPDRPIGQIPGGNGAIQQTNATKPAPGKAAAPKAPATAAGGGKTTIRKN